MSVTNPTLRVYRAAYGDNWSGLSAEMPWDSPRRAQESPFFECVARRAELRWGQQRWLAVVCKDTAAVPKLRDFTVEWARAMVGDVELLFDTAAATRAFWEAILLLDLSKSLNSLRAGFLKSSRAFTERGDAARSTSGAAAMTRLSARNRRRAPSFGSSSDENSGEESGEDDSEDEDEYIGSNNVRGVGRRGSLRSAAPKPKPGRRVISRQVTETSKRRGRGGRGSRGGRGARGAAPTQPQPPSSPAAETLTSDEASALGKKPSLLLAKLSKNRGRSRIIQETSDFETEPGNATQHRSASPTSAGALSPLSSVHLSSDAEDMLPVSAFTAEDQPSQAGSTASTTTLAPEDPSITGVAEVEPIAERPCINSLFPPPLASTSAESQSRAAQDLSSTVTTMERSDTKGRSSTKRLYESGDISDRPRKRQRIDAGNSIPQNLEQSVSAKSPTNQPPASIINFDNLVQSEDDDLADDLSMSPNKNKIIALKVQNGTRNWVEFPGPKIAADGFSQAIEEVTLPYRLRELPPRPPLPSRLRPYAWSKTRQELCETFPRFRNYQGGVYARDGIAIGYLLSGYPSERDRFLHGGRLIISHGGGGSSFVLEEANGKRRRVLKNDQSDNLPSCNALLNAWKCSVPLVLVMAKNWALFPYDCGDKHYCVLGWYWIQHIWYEPELDIKSGLHSTRMKVAFSYCNSQDEPWWLSPITTPSPPPDDTPFDFSAEPPIVISSLILPPKAGNNSFSCAACRKPSRIVYTIGPMCLQQDCALFWITPDTHTSPHGEGLFYTDLFLSIANQPDHIVQTWEDFGLYEANGKANDKHGIHCRHCGRMGCRSSWSFYKCETLGCPTLLDLTPRLRQADWLPRCGVSRSGDYEADVTVRVEKHTIMVDATHNAKAPLIVFILPAQRGAVAILRGTNTAMSEAGRLVEALNKDLSQQPTADEDGRNLLKRHALKATRSKMETSMLTQYFSQNFGVPYKHVAGTDTTIPFDKAPFCVRETMDLIASRAQLVASGARFNEMLVAAYLDDCKMNYHSDFEPGLGEDIASLSLGYPAKMTFRPMAARNKDDAANQPSRRGEQVTLRFTLYHGDILLMHGRGIQKCYEHKVEPEGFRIAATARFIDSTIHP
ncbi:hypothetical protein BKA62DRAFT_694201 [Auriculariales sp. MPI-PUGE-AT-0066]|nr:hypothetical protein BKA62DRAFT_694201 [Auriculariales sp. MPI-PUGE-AT-0066]